MSKSNSRSKSKSKSMTIDHPILQPQHKTGAVPVLDFFWEDLGCVMWMH